MSELREAALASKAWPYEEARKLLKRYEKAPPEKGYVLFQTGYGPSGLPHIGTFQEVARTTMVRHAFAAMSDLPTRLICFSDDMDALRKVPPNLPNHELLRAHLDQPLCRIPDPYRTHKSFAAHNNALLRGFLDRFGFEYEFLAASDVYAAGRFDGTMKAVLRHYGAIMDVMLPTLGAERRLTYSPVFPIHPETGKVLQLAVEVVDADAGLVAYVDPETGKRREQSILGGQAKLQWKVDWAQRQVAFGVDYEMYGKDLIDSAALGARICRILGARPPEGFNYEMFLDEDGGKISKSKGNGLTIEEWLKYAPLESLAFYIYRDPRKARQLSFSVIPKAVDEYHQFLAAYPGQPVKEKLGNPVHHVHDGAPPPASLPFPYAMLLNLVSVAGSDDKDFIWGFVRRYAPEATKESCPALDDLIDHALVYFRDFIAASLRRRAPDERERAALIDLDRRLAALPDDADAETIQNEVYAAGKEAAFDPLRDWFKALYETLLGSSQGPRMGGFFRLYGLDGSRRLIAEALGDMPRQGPGEVVPLSQISDA